jgi:CheY-like chemotaxis protein
MAVRYKPDLIFMDLRMPHMDGYEATGLIKNNSLTSHIPIIILTASTVGFEKGKDAAIGDSYLRKPILKKSLIDEMMKYLACERSEKLTAQRAGRCPEEENYILQEKKDEMPRLLQLLQQECVPEWKKLLIGIKPKQVSAFAKQVHALASEFGSPYLESYAARLEMQARNFDVRKLPATIKEFSSIMEKLENAASPIGGTNE